MNHRTNRNRTARRLAVGIVGVLLLSFCFGITSVALIRAEVSVENNYFHTGTVDINLNDGKPVITKEECMFEPGMTVVREFFVENNSTWAVYYKIYLDHVKGDLDDVIQVKILDGQELLYSGMPSRLTRAHMGAAQGELQAGERRTLSISFHFPKEGSNDFQNQSLSFDLCADAVQTKNNPNKVFE